MKIIVKNSVNELLLTLNEKVSIENAYFLMGIHNEHKDSWSYILLTNDDSRHQDKYNLFKFNEPVTFEFPTVGLYSFRVWERNSATIPVGFNSETKEGLLESGRILVKPQDETRTKAYDNDNETTVYDG